MNATDIRESKVSQFALRRDILADGVQTYSVGAFPHGYSSALFAHWEVSFCGFELLDQPIREFTIRQGDIPADEPYRLIRDFRGKTTQNGPTEFIAEIEEANLAATGKTPVEAINSLVFELLDAFDYLSANESRLGPEPARQLTYLRDRIAKTDNRPR
jgi:hypothetical protein